MRKVIIFNQLLCNHVFYSFSFLHSHFSETVPKNDSPKQLLSLNITFFVDKKVIKIIWVIIYRWTSIYGQSFKNYFRTLKLWTKKQMDKTKNWAKITMD